MPTTGGMSSLEITSAASQVIKWQCPFEIMTTDWSRDTDNFLLPNMSLNLFFPVYHYTHKLVHVTTERRVPGLDETSTSPQVIKVKFLFVALAIDR